MNPWLMGDLNLNSLLDFLGFKGDPAALPVSEVTENVIDALAQNLPQLFESLRNEIGPTELAKLVSQETTAPRAAALYDKVIRDYGPSIARTENQISAERKLSDAAGDLAVVKGPGGELARAATDLGANVIDPEFFSTRKALGQKYGELIGGLDPNKLSGGERAEVERSLAADRVATGNIGNNNAVNTVENAMGFGSALNAKRAAIGNILNNTTAVVPNLRSGINPYGKPQVDNTSTTKFEAVKPIGQETFGTGNNFLQQVGQFGMQEQDINANRRDSLDRLTELVGAL